MKTLAIIAVFMFSVSVAQAGNYCTHDHNHDLDLPCLVDESDYYLGLGYGKEIPYATNHTATDSEFMTYSLLFGKRISPRLAIEGGYVRAGSLYNEFTGRSTKVQIYSVTLAGRQPLDEKHYFALYGHIGYASSLVTIVNVGNNMHGDWTYGGGLEIALSPSRLWYLRIGIDQYNTGALTVITPGVYEPQDYINNYTATLLYNF